MADETEAVEQENEDGASASSGEEKNESQKAQEKEEERNKAKEKIKEMEKGEPPKDIEDWPDDAAKYETFGGAEGEHGYHEGPEEAKLGPSSLRHHEDGTVTIAGEEVDDPDQYKSDPIPGGPTDPNAAQDLTSKKIRESQGRELDTDSDGGDDDSEGQSEEDEDDDSAKAEKEKETEESS